MFRSAPVALRWTRMSFERANRVRGTRAPDLAILVLLSSAQNGEAAQRCAGKGIDNLHSPCVAKFVTQPTALHCTSTLGLSICLMRGSRPPSFTMSNLLSAVVRRQHRSQLEPKTNALFTARFPRAALAARCTSVS